MKRVRFFGRQIAPDLYMAKLDHVWKAARRWAQAAGKQHSYSNVQGVAPL